jgi:deoxyribodipyrimidine photolyase
MVTASFLCKDLGLDWRWGEAWFARHLLDFDLAANNGGWQWAASSGCDAQPYFPDFNPVSQSQKFDREARFIRRYVPRACTAHRSANSCTLGNRGFGRTGNWIQTWAKLSNADRKYTTKPERRL